MTELRAGGATDTGLVRDHNEDNYLTDEGLFAVADGVGGHKAGEVASQTVGDSRAYLLQQGELEQLTEDHSLVEQLVREGQLTPAEAQVHPQRSIITRALGLDPEVEVDSWELTPYKGDRILLCSDGLTNEV